MTLRILVLTAAIGIAPVSIASGQTNDNPFRMGTALSAFAGGTADTDGTSPAAGLELGWEIVPHLAIEGATLWSTPGDGRHEFAVVLGPKFTFAHGQRRVPFVSLGAGMYRATFDDNAASVPEFYASRMASATAPRRVFDDFVASIGGGADFYLHTHWAIRPDVRLLIVAGDGDRRWVSTFGVHVAYHFEHHHISE